MNTRPCPTCGRPAAALAFPTTADYVRCALGHVFAKEA